jgi:hypothetical protein
MTAIHCTSSSLSTSVGYDIEVSNVCANISCLASFTWSCDCGVPLEEGLVLRVGVEDWEEDLDDALLVEDNALVGAFLVEDERALEEEEEEVLVLVLVLVPSELRSQGLALRVLGVVPDELLAAGRDELVFVFGIFRIYEEMMKEK